jgi:hypothetical protein
LPPKIVDKNAIDRLSNPYVGKFLVSEKHINRNNTNNYTLDCDDSVERAFELSQQKRIPKNNEKVVSKGLGPSFFLTENLSDEELEVERSFKENIPEQSKFRGRLQAKINSSIIPKN